MYVHMNQPKLELYIYTCFVLRCLGRNYTHLQIMCTCCHSIFRHIHSHVRTSTLWLIISAMLLPMEAVHLVCVLTQMAMLEIMAGTGDHVTTEVKTLLLYTVRHAGWLLWAGE